MTSPIFDLRPLLGDALPGQIDQPFMLCDAALDDPLHYLFEADHWRDVIGAGRQLMTLRDQWAKVLPTGSVVLRHESDRLVAFVLVQNDTRWQTALSQLVTAISGTLLLNSGAIQLTAAQAFNGLYRTPTRVIGIPGMTDHQSRINHYYGVENPSTLPSSERIAERRHFGEALTLVMANQQRAADDGLTFPFYECLPLCVQCVVCQSRPAEVEPTATATMPLCAICARKRRFVTDVPLPAASYALISASAPGAERLLLSQSPPGAYQRMALTLAEAWGKALRATEKSEAIVLWQSASTAWLIAPPDTALNTVARLCSAFGSASGPLALGKPAISASIAFAAGGTSSARALSRAAQNALNSAINGAQRDRDLSPGAIRLTTVNTGASDLTAEADQIRYTPETLGRLDAAAHTFAANGFPIGLLDNLSLQGATQSASLAYEQARTRLTTSQRQQLEDVARDFERIWGVGTARFYQALRDAQLVQDQISLNRRQPGTKAL
jgi:hypothetical protein